LESDVFNLKALQQENDTLQQENDILRSELKAAQFDRAYGGSID
jgi:cell division protein FtsB